MSLESPLRARLRALLLDARRNRDRTVAAEAVVVPEPTSAPEAEHVAGAATVVGSTEAERQSLDEDEERRLAHAELDAFAASLEQLARLDAARAAETAHAVQVVRDVLARERR